MTQFSRFAAVQQAQLKTSKAMMNGIPTMRKGSDKSTKEKKPMPDKSKTEIPCDHYLKRFQIWDLEEFRYVPYDPSANASPPAPKEEDKNKYFYIDTRYEHERAEPKVWVTNFGKPSLAFLRVTVGDTFFYQEPEYLVTSFFPKLSLMRKTLATAQSFALSDKTYTQEECLQVVKAVGLNDVGEENCMPSITSSIPTLIMQHSNPRRQI